MGRSTSISDILDSVDSPEGHRRVAEYLKNTPYPHYEPSDTPGLLIRITEDGKRTLGRFVNRHFQGVDIPME